MTNFVGHMANFRDKGFIIVADAGSTKVDWALVNFGNGTQLRVSTAGINGVTSSDEHIGNTLADLVSKIRETDSFFAPEDVDSLAFFGAGCATPEICNRIGNILSETFPNLKEKEVHSDLVGAAIALFGSGSGIACILGTGSNSCLYREGKVEANISPLGYILGDEGSGTALGKRLIREIFRNLSPSDTTEAFFEYFNMNLKEVLDRVYRSEKANVFLASMVPFLKDNEKDPYVRNLIKTEFKHFIDRTVKHYKDSTEFPLGFIGSIALNFKKILLEVAEEEGYEVKEVIQKPIDGIIRHYKK